jgi:hypothetical protein
MSGFLQLSARAGAAGLVFGGALRCPEAECLGLIADDFAYTSGARWTCVPALETVPAAPLSGTAGAG